MFYVLETIFSNVNNSFDSMLGGKLVIQILYLAWETIPTITSHNNLMFHGSKSLYKASSMKKE